jgi:hypothetical protein
MASIEQLMDVGCSQEKTCPWGNPLPLAGGRFLGRDFTVKGNGHSSHCEGKSSAPASMKGTENREEGRR